MRVTNYTDLQKKMEHYFNDVVLDNEPLLVNRDDAAPVVIMSLDDYNAIKETEYVLRSPAMLEAIRQGEEDIKNGRCTAMQDGETVEEFLERCIE